MTGKDLIDIIQHENLEITEICENYDESEIRFRISEETDIPGLRVRWTDKVINMFTGEITVDVTDFEEDE